MTPFQTTPVSRVANFIDFYAEAKACLSPAERQMITDIEDELMSLDAITQEAFLMWERILHRLCRIAQAQGIPVPLEFPTISEGMDTESSLDWYLQEQAYLA